MVSRISYTEGPPCSQISRNVLHLIRQQCVVARVNYIGHETPSRQMARTGGNCGLLLALVSPVGCKSRNAETRRSERQQQQHANPSNPSSQPAKPSFSSIFLLHGVTVARSHLLVPRRFAPPFRSPLRNYSRDGNAGMRISPL